jgi:hypothetical protein
MNPSASFWSNAPGIILEGHHPLSRKGSSAIAAPDMHPALVELEANLAFDLGLAMVDRCLSIARSGLNQSPL